MNARVDMKVNQAELTIAVEKSVAAPNYAPIQSCWIAVKAVGCGTLTASAILTSCRRTPPSVTLPTRVWSLL